MKILGVVVPVVAVVVVEVVVVVVVVVIVVARVVIQVVVVQVLVVVVIAVVVVVLVVFVVFDNHSGSRQVVGFAPSNYSRDVYLGSDVAQQGKQTKAVDIRY